MALSRYIAQGKIPKPNKVMLAGMKIHDWTEEEIEHVRQLLPKIKNGRKTRYKKKQLTNSNRQLVKTKSKAKKKPQPRAAHGAPGSSTVPHKHRRKKK